ncbi:hypothetical protein [Streptomyces adustus]|nr:hypothetical protein [Streptomyces adustus]
MKADRPTERSSRHHQHLDHTWTEVRAITTTPIGQVEIADERTVGR